ncbi:haloacid dehalogenase-like hydrolase [Clostridium perfringens]|nr:haloacid dehalogenase-like hydrolase [Clostridium perfringens]
MKNHKKITLSIILASVMTASLVSCGTNSVNNDSSDSKAKVESATETKENYGLEELNWDPDNYKALVKVIKEYGKDSENYDEKQKPYAVFDWDNTTIMNDVEEALLAYQLTNLEFKMTPERLDAVMKTNIPEDNFVEACNNKEGKPVNIDLITEDITSDYTYLYENYEGFKGNKPLDEIKKTKEYEDFKAKLRYLYNAIGESFSSDVSYPWVTYLFEGMTSDEVAKLTEKSNDYWLNEKLGKETWTSSQDIPGKAGVVSVTFDTGLRTIKEQQNLYKTLVKNGIDVYICSASYIDVVREFATNPKYGYELPAKNIYAMELLKTDDGKIKAELNPEYYQTQGKGKTETIKKFLVPTHNKGPVITGGDSNGDFYMLSDFEDTKVSLIINRCKGGKIGELCTKAIDSMGKPDERYFLQGRNNNTGEFIPSEKTILLGETTEKLK